MSRSGDGASSERRTRVRVLATAYDFKPRLGGVATCAYELTRALAEIPGIEVHLLSNGEPGAAPVTSSLLRRHRRSRGTLLAALHFAMALFSECRRRRPDAILNFLWLPEGLATWLALAALRAATIAAPRAPRSIPYFVVVHGVEILEARSTWRKKARGALAFVKRAVLRGAAGIFAVSGYTAKALKDRCGADPRQVQVIWNGVDPKLFTPAPAPARGPAEEPDARIRERYGIEGKRVFLTISRLQPYKGIDQAIRALSRLAPTYPDLDYLICGEGPDRARLEALARELGIAQRVRFAGAVPGEDLPALYRICECHVLLSREDLAAPEVEGFGIVFLEAAASSKPSIAGRSGGIPDAVLDGQTGWLVDPLDEAAIASAMSECLDRPERAAELGRNGRRRVEESMTWKHVASRAATEILKHVRD